MGILEYTMPSEPDPFGLALWDAYLGKASQLIFHRDDGQIDGHSTSLYLAGPEAFDKAESCALGFATGRVLDIGCGAGRHGLVLQQRGAQVVGLDVSPLAVYVSLQRGLRTAVRASALAPPFAARSFDTFLLMGNNLGLGGSVDGTLAMLEGLRWMSRSRARLIASCRSPTPTENPVHLSYHRRNQAMGRPIGQVTMRVEYQGTLGPWFDLLLLTPDDACVLAEGSGWRVRRLLHNDRGLFSLVLETD